MRFPLETCSSSTNCSSCVTNSDPLCGWCSVENKCSVTCSTNFITSSSGCLLPMITSISPDSGPTEGGTTVTITGTDLGTSFSDIVSITVGSLSCTPIENSYLVGRRISCDISSSSQAQQPGMANVVVTVSRMGGVNHRCYHSVPVWTVESVLCESIIWTSCWRDNSESERRGPEHWEHREDYSITGGHW